MTVLCAGGAGSNIWMTATLLFANDIVLQWSAKGQNTQKGTIYLTSTGAFKPLYLFLPLSRRLYLFFRLLNRTQAGRATEEK